LGRPSL